MSKVSVVIATYNGEQFVQEQLLSLLLQTRKPDEVIICDDTSTDSTVSIIRKFIEEHCLVNWQLIENKNNMGYKANFKKTMRLSSGDYVFLCDQDDIWHKDKIERMISIMESDASIQALASTYQCIDQNGNPLENQPRKFYRRSLFSVSKNNTHKVKGPNVLHSNIAQGCTGCYRKSLIEKYIGTNCTNMPHDWALNLLAYLDNGLYFLNEELVLYRIHGNNTIGIGSKRDAVIYRVSRLQAYIKDIEAAIQLPLDISIKNEIIEIIHFTNMRIRWLTEKKYTDWFKAVIHYPHIFTRYFFKQYMKDLLLVVLKKL